MAGVLINALAARRKGSAAAALKYFSACRATRARKRRGEGSGRETRKKHEKSRLLIKPRQKAFGVLGRAAHAEAKRIAFTVTRATMQYLGCWLQVIFRPATSDLSRHKSSLSGVFIHQGNRVPSRDTRKVEPEPLKVSD